MDCREVIKLWLDNDKHLAANLSKLYSIYLCGYFYTVFVTFTHFFVDQMVRISVEEKKIEMGKGQGFFFGHQQSLESSWGFYCQGEEKENWGSDSKLSKCEGPKGYTRHLPLLLIPPRLLLGRRALGCLLQAKLPHLLRLCGVMSALTHSDLRVLTFLSPTNFLLATKPFSLNQPYILYPWRKTLYWRCWCCRISTKRGNTRHRKSWRRSFRSMWMPIMRVKWC